MDTAPKDGTSILVWDGYTIQVASWGYDDLWRHEPKEWITGRSSGEYNVHDTVDEPTHWMPLPNPPEAGSQTER